MIGNEENRAGGTPEVGVGRTGDHNEPRHRSIEEPRCTSTVGAATGRRRDHFRALSCPKERSAKPDQNTDTPPCVPAVASTCGTFLQVIASLPTIRRNFSEISADGV